MPTDVSIDVASRSLGAFETLPPHRLPIGVGLTLGACASVALWTFIGFGLRALLA
jgi:hypothetical protein